MANARTARLLSLLALSTICAGPSWADGAGQRETLALQACLFDYQGAEHQCFDVTYYTCMGEQLGIAANPTLAKERCLLQEFTVWTNLIEDACEDLGEIIEPGSATWDALCFENNAPNWSYITRGLNSSDQASDARQTRLQLAAESARSFAVQIRKLLRKQQN
ncbi:hypothetical protein [Mesobacterium pallidum]|uniref:hypothetical protein n=1 Tax=Mesobacterium pallidum TaxID=2872037 RepID=UPI001EE282C7|nr:hypothetical protein [Mesobacterium pallidum]